LRRIKRLAAFATHGFIGVLLLFAFVRGENPEQPLKTAGVASRKKPPVKKAAPIAKKAEPQTESLKPATVEQAPIERGAEPAEAISPQDTAKRHVALLDRLVAAYPDFLSSHDEASVIWRDGTRMPFDDGRAKTYGERLELPDIEDSFFDAYPTGRQSENPPADFDPGRSRYDPFFTRMYGDCKAGDVEKRMGGVIWLPKNSGVRIQATTINGVDRRLQQVSDELDALPAEFMKFLKPIAGVYNCRPIAGTARLSMHAYAAAIDISAAFGDYWQNNRPVDGKFRHRNRVPWEIVEIFEKHGFIWGGKWSRFDTFHFEYRPELLPGFNPALPVPLPAFLNQPQNLRRRPLDPTQQLHQDPAPRRSMSTRYLCRHASRAASADLSVGDAKLDHRKRDQANAAKDINRRRRRPGDKKLGNNGHGETGKRFTGGEDRRLHRRVMDDENRRSDHGRPYECKPYAATSKSQPQGDKRGLHGDNRGERDA